VVGGHVQPVAHYLQILDKSLQSFNSTAQCGTERIGDINDLDAAEILFGVDMPFVCTVDELTLDGDMTEGLGVSP
jgi:hypothetical protein